MAHQRSDPFWDFIRSFDPNSNTPGTNNYSDNATNNRQEDSYPPEFIRGFPFFNPSADWRPQPESSSRTRHGPGAGPSHRRRGNHTRQGPPPQAWANSPFAWADWAAAGPEGHPWFAHPQQQQQQQQQQARQAEQQRQQAQQQAQQQAEKQAEQQARQQAQQQRAEQVRQQAQQQGGLNPQLVEHIQQHFEQQRVQQEKEQEKEKAGSPDTMRADSDTTSDPPEVTPDASEHGEVPPSTRPHCRRGGRRHPHHHQGRNNEQPQFPFDLSSLLTNISSHPFLQNLQEQATRASNPGTGASDSNTFTPPLDLFSTPASYILHLPLPGALKPDIGVDWDPESQTLRVAGVVHRPGDEELQKMLVKGERKVGVFEREIRLPPVGLENVDEKEEVDADGITAKMEDGVLVIVVPKKEKEWTEIKKVDIE